MRDIEALLWRRIAGETSRLMRELAERLESLDDGDTAGQEAALQAYEEGVDAAVERLRVEGTADMLAALRPDGLLDLDAWAREIAKRGPLDPPGPDESDLPPAA